MVTVLWVYSIVQKGKTGFNKVWFSFFWYFRPLVWFFFQIPEQSKKGENLVDICDGWQRSSCRIYASWLVVQYKCWLERLLKLVFLESCLYVSHRWKHEQLLTRFFCVSEIHHLKTWFGGSFCTLRVGG